MFRFIKFLFLCVACGCVGITAAPTKPSGILITQPTRLTANVSQDYILQSGSLYGSPSSTGQGVVITGNVTFTGPGLLQDVVVHGCILVNRASRVELTRVWQTGCTGDGIIFQSDPIPDGNQSCCAKLDHVVSIENGGAGLKIVNTADIFIIMSEFENNQDCGVRLVGSPTTRIVNSDFGGNSLCGLHADSTSHKTMLSNNQYGNNVSDDLVLQSQDNIINSQEFIGPVNGACAVRAIGRQVFGANFAARPICAR